MRHVGIVGAVLVLIVAAGLGMIAAAVLAEPPPVTSLATEDSGIVDTFYAAANESIATGDTSTVRRVVAPYFVDRVPLPAMATGRDGLEDYLVQLHRADPTVRLTPDVIAASGDLIVAQVTVRRNANSSRFPDATGGALSPWGGLDIFRVAGGVIVERWNQADGTGVVRPLAIATFDLPNPVPNVVTLQRVTLQPGARWTAPATGPHLIAVEAGMVRVAVREQSAGEAGYAIDDATSLLAAGTSLPVAAHIPFSIANASGGETRLVIAAFDEPHVPSAGAHGAGNAPHVSLDTLAGGLAARIGAGQMDLMVERVVLARGTQVSLSGSSGPVLVAVETGEIGMISSGQTWVRNGSDGIHRAVSKAALMPRDGLLLEDRDLAILCNQGAGPAIAMVVTMRTGSAPAGTD